MAQHPEEATLSPAKRALLALKDLQSRLDLLEQARREPVAIVGLGCRFPGGDSPRAFWRLLRAGGDAVSEVPPERWDIDALYSPDPQTPGTMCARRGGFVEGLERFDPAFFRISPREAASLDPQQRLLLEVSWEALEHAGLAPDRLFRSPTGVFVGMTNFDHSIALLRRAGREQIDMYFGTGGALSMGAGRLSYLLGLTGPSMVVDTACSSSLVALHLACQSLRAGECDTALAGGVNVLSAPEVSINLSRAGMLAPDGCCKTFDASADGYVRGEGCGMVVLKRLSDARRDGDTVLALIRGSAVNQDGPSGGLTVPNGPSQEQVIRQALASGGVDPASVQYVEAHGTGTPLGDPIELGALGDVFGPGRAPGQPLLVGSVKTNIGHLESAAGVAGLIKVVLALRHGLIPPNLHFRTPSPHIPWARLPVAVPTAPQPWRPGPRLAGVSSFGFSGTNAHVVLEEAPPAGREEAGPERPAHLLVLSARSEPALRELAARYRDHLAQAPDLSPGDVCFTAATGRSHFGHRLSAVGSSCAELSERLAAFAAGQESAGLAAGPPRQPPTVAFLFSGQGAQYAGMGRRLYATQPVFRAALDRCAELLAPELGLDIRPLIFSDEPAAEHQAPRTADPGRTADPTEAVAGSGFSAPDGPARSLEQTWLTQPALFALEYGLAELWRAWGVRPKALLGHSLGEYVAACVAGVFSLEDALRLVVARARLMQSLPEGGQMAAVLAGEARVAEAIRPFGERVAVAAVNSPRHCTISGEAAAVQAVRERLEAEGVETRPLRVSHAFHSALIEPILPDLARAAAGLRYASPQVALIANLTGDLAGDAVASPDYWVRQARQPVRFAEGVAALGRLGIDLLIEIGPEPVLCALGRQTLPDQTLVWLPSLRRREPDWQPLLRSLGALYVCGAAVDWAAFEQAYPRRRVELPTYPFQRQRHWLDACAVTPEGGAMSEPTAWTNGAQPAAPARDRVSAALREIVAAALQIAPSELGARVSFIDLGADSMVLLEAIRRIEQVFGLKLAIRQLFEELATLDALAAHVEERLPPGWGAAGPAAPPASAAPAASPAQPAGLAPAGAPPGAPVEALLREQIQAMSRLMSEQLALLGAGALPAPTSVPPAQAPSAAAPPAQARGGDGMFAFGQAAGHQRKTKVLTSQQQSYLDGFAARYNRRTQRSKQFTATHRPVWADIRSTMGFRQETKELCYTLVAERASGSRMWDIDGNEYIDVAMGFGVHLFGHGPAFINQAVAEQLGQSAAIGPQSKLVGEVSRLISELTGMERVTYCNSGTEAVMTAIRLARAASGRTRMAIFSDAYHGHSDHTLAIAKLVNGVRETVPWVPGVPQSVVGEVLVLPYGDPAALEVLRGHLPELAAVLVEPVQSRRPNLQPAEFLRELRQMTAAADVTLIFDEVITGFRIHTGGAQAHFGIRADLATYGKIVGGGMPIGVVAGAARYLDRIDGGAWQYGDDSFPPVVTSFAAGTFCKHPLAMAAARAVLTRLRDEGPALLEQVSRRTERMAQTLEACFQREDLAIRIARFGSIFRFTLGSNFSYLYQPLEMDLLFYQLLSRGIYLWEGRTCFLSTEHSDADVDRLVGAVQEGLAELRGAGFFDGSRSGGGPSGSPQAASGERRAAVEEAEPYVLHTFPLTRAQQQLWALAQMGDDGMISSKVAGALRIRGPLDPQALRRALQTVADRHETLRSTLGQAGDVQHVWSSLTLDLPLVDLSSLAPEQREAQTAAWFEQESRRTFDFAAGPLFRATLIRLEPQSHILVWATHHIVVDGWSVTVILRELGALYGELCGGPPARLRPPLQFREYLDWQRQRLQSSAMAASARYWRDLLAGAPALSLPTDRPRPQIKTYTGRRLTRRYEAGLGRTIKRAAQDSGVTTFMLLLALHNVLLHQVSGQDDLIVGVPTAGRSLERGDEIVGYCTNVMPVRSHLAEGQTFCDYLRALRGALLEAYEHQDYPFAELLDQLNLRRDPSASPLVAAIFNLEPRVPVQRAFSLEVDLITPFISFTAYDLDLNITEIGDEFILDFDHNSDLFDQSSVAGLLDDFEALLREVARDPAQPVAALYRGLRAQAEREAQQAVRQQLKRLRQERLRRNGPDPLVP